MDSIRFAVTAKQLSEPKRAREPRTRVQARAKKNVQ